MGVTVAYFAQYHILKMSTMSMFGSNRKDELQVSTFVITTLDILETWLNKALMEWFSLHLFGVFFSNFFSFLDRF